MKKLLFSLFALLLFSVSLFAQRGQGEGPRRGGQDWEPDPVRQVQGLTQKLNLSETQSAELTEYFTANFEAMNGELEGATTREEKLRIRGEYLALRDEKVTSILDADQLVAYEEVKAKAQARREERGPRQGRGGEARRQREVDPVRQVEFMARLLELNEGQQAELTEYFEATNEAMQGELAEAETQEDRQAIRDEYRGLRDQKIQSLLTEEQLVNYEQMKENMANRRQGRGGRRPGGNR
ncbi:MAG: hypothetical protein AAFU67_05365 [Bacteroidota bacterium]